MNNRTPNTPNPWLSTRNRTGADYDAPYFKRAQAGQDIHGEANLVEALLNEYRPNDNNLPYTVLDAGCGTGRVAIELNKRGCEVVGVDLDEVMLTQAKSKAPDLTWLQDDLHQITLKQSFDAIVMAGNVMIYLTPNTEMAVLTNMAKHLKPGGLLIVAFELTPKTWTNLTLNGYESLALSVGLSQLARWSTWDQKPWQPGHSYVVSLHSK